jgi:hypothetical protein
MIKKKRSPRGRHARRKPKGPTYCPKGHRNKKDSDGHSICYVCLKENQRLWREKMKKQLIKDKFDGPNIFEDFGL